ncbi:hypothetical protein Bca52824_033955 [Brassica carinata]|uniref:Uncharacterized protein n=1 Tax=Brassica carinata TaxID=52824 RepID=A0A8X7SJM8_BRACI|nr:hypothetical protein Bca52824_033955 [Brassica carinata]
MNMYVHLDPEIYMDSKKYEPLIWERSLSRERSCQARDFHFSSSSLSLNLWPVGYDFKTIKLNQLVRSLLSCFDPNKFSVAVH